MATAAANKVSSYTLELTQDEAEAVVAALAYVTGDGYLSPAKHTDAVYEALTGSGVGWSNPAGKLAAKPNYGFGVRFSNYKTENT